MRREQQAALADYVARRQVPQRASSVAELHGQVREQATAQRKGEAAAAAMALADEEAMLAQREQERVAALLAPKPVAGNVIEASVPAVKPNVAEPTGTRATELTAKRATTMYEAIQQMDPLGQAIMASALDVSPDVFLSPEEQEVRKRSTAAVLRWRTSMDDPNSAERKALDAGDLPGFTKLAVAAGAIDAQAGMQLMAGFADDDRRREEYGFDAKVYEQALVPLLAKSNTLTDATLAAVGTDSEGNEAPMVDASGRVIEYDVGKVLTTPGAVRDVVEAVGVAATEDMLRTKDMRPYVMGANLAFFDQVGAGLKRSLVLDQATGVARFGTATGAWFNGAEKDAAVVGAVRDNIMAYVQHQRVALVASGRFSQRAVQNMDDLDVLSIATGQPRIGAIVGSEGEPLMGDEKTIIDVRRPFAPNDYNTILEQTLPATGAGTGTAAETVSREKPGEGKKPARKRHSYAASKEKLEADIADAFAGAGKAVADMTKEFYSGKKFDGNAEE
jgi:hypothetical protein